MAAKKNKSSEIKILRQDSHNINGYSYKLDGSDFVPSTKIYFRKERCLDLPKSSVNNLDQNLDSMSVYDNFMNEIQDMLKGRTVKSLEGLPTTNLTMTILESEVDLKENLMNIDLTTKKEQSTLILRKLYIIFLEMVQLNKKLKESLRVSKRITFYLQSLQRWNKSYLMKTVML